MGNILVVDECKGSDGTLICFGCIVFKDQATLARVEQELNAIKSKHNYTQELKSAEINV